MIDYAFNRDKTERTCFETAINCDRDTAYYATKMALWCYLLPNWNIANLKVAPGLTGTELDIGNRILAAAKDIYKRGTTYNYMLEPRMTATAETSVAYPVTINGEEYI